MLNPQYALALHGGAGTMAQGSVDDAPYHAALAAAVEQGRTILQAGGSALDAVQAAVMSLEDCPLFNAGIGSVYTRDAQFELDAGIMNGATLEAGAIAGVKQVRNPVVLARYVLADPKCVLLSGDGAQRFADEKGLPRVHPSLFHTDARLNQLRQVQAMDGQAVLLDHDGALLAAQADHAPLQESSKMGTVGAVALDMHGNLAAATSTGGLTNKRPGRIGDTPIVGAGFYANNATCAVAATGTGEHFLRAVVAHDIHARMHYLGESLQQAADNVVMQSLTQIGGRGGLVAIGKDGSIRCPFNSDGMYRGQFVGTGPTVTRIYREEVGSHD